jgi:NPCBM/NEW2 domain
MLLSSPAGLWPRVRTRAQPAVLPAFSPFAPGPMLRLLASLFVCVSVARAGELHTLSGKTYQGDLASLSDKEIGFQAGNQLIKVPVAEVLRVEFSAPVTLGNSARYSEFELIDGSVLRAGQFAIQGKDLELALAGSDLKVRVPLATVATILNDAQDAAVRKEWTEKFVGRKRSQDLLVIKSDGVMNGLNGTLGDSGNARGELSFEIEVGGRTRQRDFNPAVAQGMIFLRSLGSDAPPVLCKVFDANQNVLVAGKLALDSNHFLITTVAGARLQFPRQAVARLDYSNDKVVFLSDMTPVDVVEKPTISSAFKKSYARDRNLDDGSLSIEDQIYTKGLAIHARTELTYALDGKYQKFEAVLGMDSAVESDGQPIVKIEADGRPLFSGVVTRNDKHRDLHFPVKGVRLLRIVVTSSGPVDFGDLVELGNAKLSK